MAGNPNGINHPEPTHEPLAIGQRVRMTPVAIRQFGQRKGVPTRQPCAAVRATWPWWRKTWNRWLDRLDYRGTGPLPTWIPR